MSFIEKVSALALKPSEWIGNIATKGLELITGKKYGRTTSEELAKTTGGKILGSAIAVSGAALGLAAVGSAAGATGAAAIGKGAGVVATKAATSFAKAKPLTKAAVVAGGMVAVPAVVTNPKLAEKGLEAVAKTPSSLINIGTNIGEFTAEPSLEKAKEIFTENPLIVGGALAAGVLVAGKGLAGTAATIMNTQVTKENTQAMASPQQIAIPQAQTMEAVPSQQIVKEKLIQSDEGIPESSPYSTITTGKRRYKRHKAVTSPSIRNSVRVININNNAVTKKYLKEVCYA